MNRFIRPPKCEKLLIGSHVVSAKILMTLEKSHCQATRSPKGGFVDAIYLWIEGHTTFEKSHFQDAKMPVSQVGGFNDMAGIAFSGLKNEEKLQIGSPVFYSQESHEESHCQSSKRPNRVFVDAIYLWIEGHTTF
jgi:hypothetical protein